MSSRSWDDGTGTYPTFLRKIGNMSFLLRTYELFTSSRIAGIVARVQVSVAQPSDCIGPRPGEVGYVTPYVAGVWPPKGHRAERVRTALPTDSLAQDTPHHIL